MPRMQLSLRERRRHPPSREKRGCGARAAGLDSIGGAGAVPAPLPGQRLLVWGSQQLADAR
jgi:hypothetical protein